MRGELVLSIPTLLGFVLTLVRVSGVFVFVPLPGINTVLSPARVILSLGITITLFPEWPQVTGNPTTGLFLLWILTEAALGVGIGLSVAFLIEAFSVGAQVMGLQMGYGFATTIDPNTQADSAVLIVFAQIAAGLLFFASGLDRDVLRVFARSLETCPAGSFTVGRAAAGQVLGLGSNMFSTGLRLALPIIAVMVMIDISLALLGRVNAQLHLITVAFPVKMIVGLALLSWLALLFPVMMRAGADSTLRAAQSLIAR